MEGRGDATPARPPAAPPAAGTTCVTMAAPPSEFCGCRTLRAQGSGLPGPLPDPPHEAPRPRGARGGPVAPPARARPAGRGAPGQGRPARDGRVSAEAAEFGGTHSSGSGTCARPSEPGGPACAPLCSRPRARCHKRERAEGTWGPCMRRDPLRDPRTSGPLASSSFYGSAFDRRRWFW